MIRHLFSAAFIVMLGGCAGIVTPPMSFTIYDLDLPAAATRPASTALAPAAIEVRAPSWLSNAAMQYRFDFRPPGSREVYAQSRWAGHPSEMLQREFVASLTAAGDGTGNCRLRIDLDEFIQRFESLESSASEIIVRASLLAPREETVLARERFVILTPTLTADAAGGVLAHRAGATRLTHALAAWLDTLDGERSRRLNVHERCRP